MSSLRAFQSSSCPPGATRKARKVTGRPDVRTHATSEKPAVATRTISRRVQTQSSASEYDASPSRDYINFTGFPFPLGPLKTRRTTMQEIVKDTMWAFEQPQGLAFSNVQVNVRMTVIRLKSGGLFIYNPIAPTDECLQMLSNVGGNVEYMVLATAAYEHKIFMGPFQRRFPEAEVYVAPQQWSFPLNLPVQFYGIFPKGVLKNDDKSTPWASELEQKVLAAPKFAVAGLYSEVAFFHKPSKTLLVTDAVVQLPRRPPDCLSPETLLDNAKDGFVVKTADAIYGTGNEGKTYDPTPVEDTPQNRLRGWQRICLLVCFFGPHNLYDPEESFNRYAGRPFVFPVVSELVYKRVPDAVRSWIDDIAADWNFNKIVPSHFDAPITCRPRDLVAAYQRSTSVYSRSGGEADATQPPEGLLQQLLALRTAGSKPGSNVLNPDDLKALDNINWFLEAIKAIKKVPK